MAVVTASSSSCSGLWVGHSSTLRFSRPPPFRTQLGFLSSQLSGISISYPNNIVSPKPISAPLYRPFRPIARDNLSVRNTFAVFFEKPVMISSNSNGQLVGRICPFTGKKTNRANNVSHSNTKTKKLQFVNLQYKRLWWEGGKRWVKLRLSTKALKTIEKNGLDAVAKKAGIDLSKK